MATWSCCARILRHSIAGRIMIRHLPTSQPRAECIWVDGGMATRITRLVDTQEVIELEIAPDLSGWPGIFWHSSRQAVITHYFCKVTKSPVQQNA